VAWLSRPVDPIEDLVDLGDVLVALGLELRAGVLPDRALVVAAGSARDPALRRAASFALCAEDPTEAMLSSEQPVVRALGAAWRLSATAGAPLAPAAARLASTCRGQAEALRELRAALAGPRASARILAGLPVLGLLLGQAMGGHPTRVLLTTGLGHGCLAAGCLAIAAGLWWTRVLVRRAEGVCTGAR
jgi:tight adherence protein B